MDGSSWLRRSFFRDIKKSKNPDLSDQRVQDDEDIFGVTEQLIDFVKTFTLEPSRISLAQMTREVKLVMILQAVFGMISQNGRRDMRSLFSPKSRYELQAMRRAKIKEMSLVNGKSTADRTACEVEMAETKNAANLPPSTS